MIASESIFTVSKLTDPKNLAEAMNRQDSREQKIAIDAEYRSLVDKQTWSLVERSELPKGAKVLTGKLVLKTKRDKDGKILKYKARWVVRGFEQRYGRDFTHTYAGVCRNTSWKIAIALAAKFDLEIERMDAVTAFLNSNSDNDIYVEVPPGWRQPGMSTTYPFVCKLQKALYGLKQAQREWYKKFSGFMQTNGYYKCNADHCCYFKRFQSSYIILLLYVDDM